MISVHDVGSAGALGTLSAFREAFYDCLRRRADALFEPTEAVLRTDGTLDLIESRGHDGYLIYTLRTRGGAVQVARAEDG